MQTCCSGPHQDWESGVRKFSYFPNVEVSVVRKIFLNMVVIETLIGYRIKEWKVIGAKNKIPKFHINLVDGRRINGYSAILNYSDRLKILTQVNEFSALLGGINQDKSAQRETQNSRSQQDNEYKAKKDKANIYTGWVGSWAQASCRLYWRGCVGHILGIKIPQLKTLLCYHYFSEK